MECARNQRGMLECCLGMHGMCSESALSLECCLGMHGMHSESSRNAGILTSNAWIALAIISECWNAALECMECTRNHLGMLECCLGMHGMHSESSRNAGMLPWNEWN